MGISVGELILQPGLCRKKVGRIRLRREWQPLPHPVEISSPFKYLLGWGDIMQGRGRMRFSLGAAIGSLPPAAKAKLQVDGMEDRQRLGSYYCLITLLRWAGTAATIASRQIRRRTQQQLNKATTWISFPCEFLTCIMFTW